VHAARLLLSLLIKKGYRMEIALIGPYPPPMGGVSVHIQRLAMRLIENGINCTVYKTNRIGYKNNADSSKNRFFKFYFVPKENIIHFHSSGYELKILIIVLYYIILGKKLVITYHSLRKTRKIIELLGKVLINCISKFNICIIAVNFHIKENFIKMGVNEGDVRLIPAFIPPVVNKEEMTAIPKGTRDFIDIHKPIISTNAANLVYYNNEDLYGIDMCIDLCTYLKDGYPKIGFICCLPYIKNDCYINMLKERVKKNNIENNFLFQVESCQLYPILMESDIFLRPTNNDGDSVSLREALYFSIPSIASDVVSRPSGAVVFKNRNIDDFISKVKNMLIDYEKYKEKLKGLEYEDGFDSILKSYQKLNG